MASAPGRLRDGWEVLTPGRGGAEGLEELWKAGGLGRLPGEGGLVFWESSFSTAVAMRMGRAEVVCEPGGSPVENGPEKH